MFSVRLLQDACVITHAWRHLTVIICFCRLLNCFYEVNWDMSPKCRNLSVATKLVIVQLFEKNVTQAEIARLLELNKSCFASTSSSQWMRFRRKPSRTGRPPLVSPGAKRVLFNDVKKSRNAPLQQITNIFNQGRARRVSKRTVQRALRAEGYQRRVIKNCNSAAFTKQQE